MNVRFKSFTSFSMVLLFNKGYGRVKGKAVCTEALSGHRRTDKVGICG